MSDRDYRQLVENYRQKIEKSFFLWNPHWRIFLLMSRKRYILPYTPLDEHEGCKKQNST